MPRARIALIFLGMLAAVSSVAPVASPAVGSTRVEGSSALTRAAAEGRTSSVSASTSASRAVAFSRSSFLTADISKAPLAKNSGVLVKDLAAQVSGVYGGVAAFNAFRYNAAYYRVAVGTRRVDVRFDDCQHKGYVPYDLYHGAAHFRSVPVPEKASGAGGTDGTISIYDAATDQLWEFWRFGKTSSGRWQACWGGRLDSVSKSQGYFPSYFGASASGIALAGGMIRVDEVRRGRIDHAMFLGVRWARSWRFVSWPAQRSDGGSSSSNVVMEGQRLRLDPKLDLSKYKLSKVGLMIARAAQKYGFFVADLSGAVAVITESGRAIPNADGSDPWVSILNAPTYTVLKNFPWSKLQALPANYGKPA